MIIFKVERLVCIVYYVKSMAVPGYIVCIDFTAMPRFYAVETLSLS